MSAFGVAIWLLTRDKRRAIPHLVKAVTLSPESNQVLSNFYGKSFEIGNDIESHLDRVLVTPADFASFAVSVAALCSFVRVFAFSILICFCSVE